MFGGCSRGLNFRMYYVKKNQNFLVDSVLEITIVFYVLTWWKMGVLGFCGYHLQSVRYYIIIQFFT